MAAMSRQRAAPKGARARRGTGRRRHTSQGDRTVALFLLGALLFNAPVLLLFDVEATVFGIPVLYVYLFAAWAVLIGLMARSAHNAEPPLGDPPPPPPRIPDEAG